MFSFLNFCKTSALPKMELIESVNLFLFVIVVAFSLSVQTIKTKVLHSVQMNAAWKQPEMN